MKVVEISLLISFTLAFVAFDEGISQNKDSPLTVKVTGASSDQTNHITIAADFQQRRDNPSRNLSSSEDRRKRKGTASRSPSKSKKKSSDKRLKKASSPAKKRVSSKSPSPKPSKAESALEKKEKKAKRRSSASSRGRPRPVVPVELTKKQKLAQLKANHLKSEIDSVIVYNVGQGNGVLVITASAIWIADFGATAGPTGLTAPEIDAKKAVGEARAVLSSADHVAKPIIILVTHPDQDHYNQIHEIFNSAPLKGRIKYWIYPNIYTAADFKKNRDTLVELGITSKRLNVSRRFIYNQDDDQTITFMNAPFIKKYKDDTNGNSLMLRLKLPRSVVVLTGDATEFTYKRARTIAPHTYYKRYSRNVDADQRLLNENWWKNINYVVAPHHGACTDKSHLISGLLEPKNGVIFSAPMYSQFSHPSLAAIYVAAKALKEALGEEINKNFLKDKKFIFWDTGSLNKDCVKGLEPHTYAEANLRASLDDVGVEKTLTYGFGPLDEFIQRIQVKSDVALADVNAVANEIMFASHEFNIGTTQLPIYITGVDGNITIKDLPEEEEEEEAEAAEIVYNENVTTEYEPNTANNDELIVILNAHLERKKDNETNKNISIRLPAVKGLINENPD